MIFSGFLVPINICMQINIMLRNRKACSILKILFVETYQLNPKFF